MKGDSINTSHGCVKNEGISYFNVFEDIFYKYYNQGY